MPINATNRQMLWGLTLLLIITAALGALRLNADILFVDEFHSIRNAGGSFYGPLDWVGVWQRTAYEDPGGMGVLYHWLLNGWGWLAGWSAYSVRVFSLGFGLLAVALIYRLGADLFSRRVGWYAAIVLASSAFFIDYLHEARAYTLIVALIIAAVYSYLRLLRDNVHPLWYAALTLSLAALAYTHYVALVIGAVLGLVHLMNYRHTRKWWAIFAAMAVGGLLFLPWLGITLEVIQRGTEDTGRQSDSMAPLQILAELFPAFSNANLALMALLAFYALRERTRQALLIWLWLGVSLILVMIVNALVPFMVHLRYVLLLWPALALIVALGIKHLRKVGIPAAILLIVWAGAGLYQYANPAFIRDQFGQIYRAPAAGFQRALHVLDERAEAGDLALWHIIPPGYEPFNYFVLDYYLQPTDLRYDQFERMGNSFAGGDMEYLRDVEEALFGVDAVWTMIIPELQTTQRSGVVNYVLATQYDSCGTIFAQDDMQMALYTRSPQDAPIGTFTEANGNIGLYDLGRGSQTDSALDVVLGWTIPDDLPENTYSVALHLLDENSTLVSQADFPLPIRFYDCVTAELPLDGVPAGAYTLRALVYDWQTGERLLAGEVDSLELRTIHLE
ncbi:MAG: glycosyltransferase family 39 protein [Anaerolineae bacterium]|nr:glycosyltransferase family 39 protein [Anaerolineae bacterium]